MKTKTTKFNLKFQYKIKNRRKTRKNEIKIIKFDEKNEFL